MAARKPGIVDTDPEKATPTVSRAVNPFEADPEKANPTVAKAPNPLRQRPSTDDEATARNVVAADIEQESDTETRAPAPRLRAHPRNSAVEVSASLQEELAADYHTGKNFQSLHDEDEQPALSPSDSLAGEGLEPMDPEIVPRTRQLPLDEEHAHEPSMVDAGPAADDENATRAGPPVQLEVTAGPDAGQTRRFKGVRMVIGRTPGVDFQLSDQSVSRRHIELVHGNQGTVLRDLGSGNGTKVNGTKVSEKVLEHGDEIAIGKTRIRYVDEMAAFKKAREDAERAQAEEADQAAAAAGADDHDEAHEASIPAQGEAEADEPAEAGVGTAAKQSGPRDRAAVVKTARALGAASPDRSVFSPMRMLIIAGAVVVVLIFAVGLFTRKPQPTTAELNRDRAEQKMQEARTAAREGRFQEAVSFAQEAERLSPGIDRSKIAAAAQEEVAQQQALDKAQALMGQKQFEDVRRVLDAAPRGSGRLDAARAKVEADLAAAEVQYKKDQISMFIAAGELEPAKRLLGLLPVEAQGPSAQQISDFENQLEQLQKDEERSARQNARAFAEAQKQRRAEEMLLAFAAVERKFAGAEWDRAASECSRVIERHPGDRDIVGRAQKLLSLIPNFGRNYEEGTRKFKQGQLGQAAKPLRAAYQLYGQMGLRQNAYGPELEQNLAQAALVAGRDALLRSDLSTAAHNFRDVVRLDPTEKRGAQGLDETLGKAEDLFNEAYTLRSLDPRDALRKFKVVIEVLPAGSATHEKAKNQIATMPQ